MYYMFLFQSNVANLSLLSSNLYLQFYIEFYKESKWFYWVKDISYILPHEWIVCIFMNIAF